MTSPPWSVLPVATICVALVGCAGDKFSACDTCGDAAAGTGGSSAGGSGGTAGAAGSAGSAGSGGSSGAAGSGGATGGSGGSGGSGGTTGSAGSGVTEAGEGFPRTAVLDDFNREDGVPGDNWLGNTSSYAISDQKLTFVSSPGHAIVWQSTLGAEQEVFATLAGVDPQAPEINVVLKAQELSDCELLEVMYSPSNQSLELHYCTGGSWYMIDSIPLTLQTGDQLGARYYANHNLHVFVNGVRATVFDASEYPYGDRGGRIGVNCEGSPDGTTAWDDFGGG